jgi:hypothetical protein
VLRRQPVAASEWFGPRVVDHEQLTRGVVLKPLPHVPFVGSSACRQLRRGGCTAFRERPTQPESVTKISIIKIILGAVLLFLAPRLWDSGSEPVPLRGRIRCGT